ncbi:MAG: RNA polymerase sigma factor [Lachnospiraceae bacterium]
MYVHTIISNDEGAEPKIRQSQIDETLFVRIGEDDCDAFAELYNLTERAVYALVLSILRDPDITQDVVQETYLKIRSASHLYKPQGKPLAWIFTISKNLAYSMLRKNKEHLAYEGELLEDSIQCSYIDDPVDRVVLVAALTILREEERQIVLLHIVSGMTHREIAKIFELPLSTVLSRYHRALKKLRKYLTQKEGF